MAKILVSLISEHLLPNYLLAKEMEGKYDKHIFITTKKMGDAGMTSRFCNTLKIEKSEVKFIVISEDDLPDAMEKLQSDNYNKDDRFIINITGGTKMMSIAAFTHFSDYNADFYYIPIAANKVENVKTGKELPLNYRVNVEEYLSLYGLRFKESEDRTNNKGFQFEREIFDRIRREKELKNGFIYCSIKLFRDDSDKTNDNEIDVMWTFDNQLFVGECKVSLFKPKELDSENRPINNPPEYLDEIMYKLSAISKDFGLKVHPYVFIKNELNSRIFNPDRVKAINKRLKILGIKSILSGKDFKKQKLEI